MLEKGPGCKANINWLKKPAEKKETSHKAESN